MIRAGFGHSYKAIIATTINSALSISTRGCMSSRKINSQIYKNESIIDLFERQPIKVRNRYTDYIDSIVAKFLAKQ